ncbi:MAG TPA: NnrU family protein [Aliidongia sp.]|nr:NnrU family protein [Aliidongia sp.]
MPLLILGLLIFIGAHSLRIFANDWRSRQVARLGPGRWKGMFALVSLVGFALIIIGFGEARMHPVALYESPTWLRHINALLTLAAFVLVAAAYVPRNHLKAAIGHPMLAGVKIWALGHLLATGMLHDVVLFGAFLCWAVADFAWSRRHDRAAGTRYPSGSLTGNLQTLAVGVVGWAVVAFWLHALAIGVNPLS